MKGHLSSLNNTKHSCLGNGFPIFGDDDDDDDDDDDYDDDHALLQLSIHWVDTTRQLFYRYAEGEM